MTQPHNGHGRRTTKQERPVFSATERRNADVLGTTVVDTTWFRHQLLQVRLSQRRLAKLIGLDPSAVSLMFRGKRRMTAEEAAAVARLLGTDVSEVMRRGGIDVRGALGNHAQRVEVGGASGGVTASGGQKIVPEIPREFFGGGEKLDLVKIPVPISGGFTAFLEIPRELSKADADRIAAIIVAFSQQN